jgi:hypothetical protein
MEKIESTPLSRLRNNEHFQFMTDVDKLISTSQASELGIEDLNSEFKNLLVIEDAVMRIELGSSKSKTIEELDKKRDQTWNAIFLRTTSTLFSPFANEIASAETVKRIIDLYGDVRSLTYNEESAAITNMVTDLLLPANAEHLNRVGLLRWVVELKNENNQFQTIFNQRNSELAGRERGDTRDIRILIDPVYEQIVEKINASIVLGIAKPIVDSFTSELNEKIKYYKTTLSSRVSREKAKKTAAAKTQP